MNDKGKSVVVINKEDIESLVSDLSYYLNAIMLKMDKEQEDSIPSQLYELLKAVKEEEEKYKDYVIQFSKAYQEYVKSSEESLKNLLSGATNQFISESEKIKKYTHKHNEKLVELINKTKEVIDAGEKISEGIESISKINNQLEKIEALHTRTKEIETNFATNVKKLDGFVENFKMIENSTNDFKKIANEIVFKKQDFIDILEDFKEKSLKKLKEFDESTKKDLSNFKENINAIAIEIIEKKAEETSQKIEAINNKQMKIFSDNAEKIRKNFENILSKDEIENILKLKFKEQTRKTIFLSILFPVAFLSSIVLILIVYIYYH